jgi:phosphohistidine phosphatase
MPPAGTVRPVRILLVRHADAVSEATGLPDEHRYLSPAGRHQVRELSALLADSGLELGAVMTSPLVRAVQTAELLVRWLDWSGSIEASQYLAPAGASLRASAEWLTRCAGPLAGAALVAVGHEPSISRLAEHLAANTGATVPSLHKAEACLIEDGALRWRLEPA